MKSEFPALVNFEKARREPVVLEQAASPDERAAAAERLGVDDVLSLQVRAALEPEVGGDVFRLVGVAELKSVRTCIVTLEAFEETSQADFEERYTRAPELATPLEDMDPEGVDVELVETDEIDVGETALQYLAMSLDPYPKAPGAMAAPDAAETADAESRRPFAGLGEMLRRRSEDR